MSFWLKQLLFTHKLFLDVILPSREILFDESKCKLLKFWGVFMYKFITKPKHTSNKSIPETTLNSKFIIYYKQCFYFL